MTPFTPTDEWQDLPADSTLPPGCQTRINMTTGAKQARRLNGAADQSDVPPPPPHVTSSAWPEPVDIIGAPGLVGWPELSPDCLPAPLLRYVTTEAERLNVDPCPIAGHVISACSLAISDAWRIRPKQYDTYTQHARVWSCVVKEVGTRGTEMIRTAFWPLNDHQADMMSQWKLEHAAWNEQGVAQEG